MRFKKHDERNLNILVINCGSSSLKYRLIKMPEQTALINGEAERVGVRSKQVSVITHTVRAHTRTIKKTLANHIEAFHAVLHECQLDQETDCALSIDGIAHRYVHPGAIFNKTTIVSARVLAKLRHTLGFAPLHNPICFSLIELCYSLFPNKKNAVVFDTAFHKTIPQEYATYALPQEMIKKNSYKRVGFHGISHEYVMNEACKFLERTPATQRIISCHLGSGGGSVCAIRHGKSINSSMGFTPLEGLLMNTRSGDVDVGLLFHVMFTHNLSAEAAEDLLNKRSGVLGVYKASSDLRDVIKNAALHGDENPILNMYVKRVRKYIGYYSMLLKKTDILLFTDTLGVQLSLLREKICEGLSLLGVQLDRDKNGNYAGGIGVIHKDSSEMAIIVVPTDEEIMIAREAYRSISNDSNY